MDHLDEAKNSVTVTEEDVQEDADVTPEESKVTIQHTDSDEEETKTLNKSPIVKPSEASLKMSIPPDSDLHEFQYDQRKFFVRLNQFNGIRTISGYLKKLCREDSMFFGASFEMRFCVMDMNAMVFKYSVSPKEQYTELDIEDLVSCNFEDPKRSKPIKIKNQKERQNDLKYLLHLIGRKRVYVLSANTRADQVMWFNGFQVFFKVKHVINLVKNGAAFSKQSLQMLEEAKARDALRSLKSSLGSATGTRIRKSLNKQQEASKAKPINAKQIGLKGSLGKPASDKATPTNGSKSSSAKQEEEKKVFYMNQKKEKQVVLKGEEVVKVKDGCGVNRSMVLPSASLHSANSKDKEDNKSEKSSEEREKDHAKKVSRAQKIIQAQFLKAAVMDDPVKREWAMSRLQILQSKLNKGESIGAIEALADESPRLLNDPKKALKSIKETAERKQQVNQTQLELAKIMEERKRQEQDIKDAKDRLNEIKHQQTLKLGLSLKSEEIKDEIRSALKGNDDMTEEEVDEYYDEETAKTASIEPIEPRTSEVFYTTTQKPKKQTKPTIIEVNNVVEIKPMVIQQPVQPKLYWNEEPRASAQSAMKSQSSSIKVKNSEKSSQPPIKLYFPMSTEEQTQNQIQKVPNYGVNPIGFSSYATPSVPLIELKPASQVKQSGYSPSSDSKGVKPGNNNKFSSQLPVNNPNAAYAKTSFQVKPPPSQKIPELKEAVVDMLQSLQTIPVDVEDQIFMPSPCPNRESLDDYNDSGPPAYIIKPFEESLTQIEAEEQTAIQPFDANEEEIESSLIQVVSRQNPLAKEDATQNYHEVIQRPASNASIVNTRDQGQPKAAQINVTIPPPQALSNKPTDQFAQPSYIQANFVTALPAERPDWQQMQNTFNQPSYQPTAPARAVSGTYQFSQPQPDSQEEHRAEPIHVIGDSSGDFDFNENYSEEEDHARHASIPSYNGPPPQRDQTNLFFSQPENGAWTSQPVQMEFVEVQRSSVPKGWKADPPKVTSSEVKEEPTPLLPRDKSKMTPMHATPLQDQVQALPVQSTLPLQSQEPTSSVLEPAKVNVTSPLTMEPAEVAQMQKKIVEKRQPKNESNEKKYRDQDVVESAFVYSTQPHVQSHVQQPQTETKSDPKEVQNLVQQLSPTPTQKPEQQTRVAQLETKPTLLNQQPTQMVPFTAPFSQAQLRDLRSQEVCEQLEEIVVPTPLVHPDHPDQKPPDIGQEIKLTGKDQIVPSKEATQVEGVFQVREERHQYNQERPIALKRESIEQDPDGVTGASNTAKTKFYPADTTSHQGFSKQLVDTTAKVQAQLPRQSAQQLYSGTRASQISVVDPIVPEATIEETIAHDDERIQYHRRRDMSLSPSRRQSEIDDGDDDEVQIDEQSPIRDKDCASDTIQPNVYHSYINSQPKVQKLGVQTEQSRNHKFRESSVRTPQQQQPRSTSAIAVTEQQVKKTRRLQITRQSNPQENSVLLDPTRSAFSSVAGRSQQLNISNLGGEESQQEAVYIGRVGASEIKLSEEYLAARQNVIKNGLSSLAGFDVRKSQRILKVVNVIGSKATNRDSSLSASRVSQIRQRQYKSKGEKVIFKHTSSRESLMLSSDFGLRGGLRATPDLTDASKTGVGRHSELNVHNQKNKLLLTSNNGIKMSKLKKPGTAASFYPHDTTNLNNLLDQMDEEDQESVNPFASFQESTALQQFNPLEETKSFAKTDQSFSLQQQQQHFQTKPQRPSLNKTTDIFKRANSTFNTSGGTVSPTQVPAFEVDKTFDEAINQQRDAFLMEKMEQQNRVAIHRKNSSQRMSIESQKRSQREESIKARRAQRKQLAMQRAAQINSGRNNQIMYPIGKATPPLQTNYSRRPPQQARQKQHRPNEDQYLLQSSSVGLSNMFGGSQSLRPATQLYQGTKFNFHKTQAEDDVGETNPKDQEDDKDSHFSEEW